VAKTRTRYRRPSYDLGRLCLLCERPIPDDHPADYCCGEQIRETFLITTPNPSGDEPEFLLEQVSFTRTRVTPTGGRRRLGTSTVDGRTIIHDEYISAPGRRMF